MDHGLFKPASFNEGVDCVVGACNGFSKEERYEKETPLFAKAILRQSTGRKILDYGCGVGRLAKEILKQDSSAAFIHGVDASQDMCRLSQQNVNDARFIASLPSEFDKMNSGVDNCLHDIAYCVYVLQHVPAIEIREILARIHNSLDENGIFVYCSSDYRMAIRHDVGGFFDDRFLGVDLQAEIERYFDKVGELFTKEELDNNPILAKMVAGRDNGLPHPAFVYRAKKITSHYFQMHNEEKENDLEVIPDTITNLVLCNRLAPGDILVMTNALRDLHKAFPGKYQTDVRTPCMEIFDNNPYVCKFSYNEQAYQKALAKFHKLTGNDNEARKHISVSGDTAFIDMHYPLIHRSGVTGSHFSEGHRDWLEKVLDVKIPQTDIRPEIYLSQTEKDWPSPALNHGVDNKYWVLNAGGKMDFTLKQYPYYQEVVNTLKSKYHFDIVQIGVKSHDHKPMPGCVDLIGKTNIRELFRLIAGSQGVITCVSFPMHIAASFNVPCVVIAGARESVRWELFNSHQFLYLNGTLACASGVEGCWKSTIESCQNKVDGVPKCHKMITPADITRAVDRYYDGGVLLDFEMLEAK
jgi:ADP-heptose:LPS heptosyltransferase/ubiquinone/menaquinone biosynthesis C-methylase UbiE